MSSLNHLKETVEITTTINQWPRDHKIDNIWWGNRESLKHWSRLSIDLSRLDIKFNGMLIHYSKI